MDYTKQEVIQFISEEDVKFIRLTFCDIYGNKKNVSIMPQEIERAFDTGIAIDASSINGFGRELHSDLFLHPDPNTLAILPWRPEHGRVVRMFCTIHNPDGSIYKNDTRSILIEAINKAKEMGLTFYFGPEMEFYLFKLDEEGNPTKIPYDNAGYMDVAPDDKGENVRREICLTLEKMGIYPESSHHEEGPGQNEIDFKYSEALSAADNACTFRTVVKTIAAGNGLYADFSPKPLKDLPGNGFHINMSVKSEDKQDLMDKMLAGVLSHIKDMTLFLNPTDDSFRRLGINKAPNYVSWSRENRTGLVRIPAAFNDYKRIELRSPDPDTNPYIAFAILIYAAIDGIKNKLALPESADIDFFEAKKDTLSMYEKLPISVSQAVTLAEESDFIRSYLPDSVIDSYVSRDSFKG